MGGNRCHPHAPAFIRTHALLTLHNQNSFILKFVLYNNSVIATYVNITMRAHNSKKIIKKKSLISCCKHSNIERKCLEI